MGGASSKKSALTPPATKNYILKTTDQVKSPGTKKLLFLINKIKNFMLNKF